jgi:hypothetical protein
MFRDLLLCDKEKRYSFNVSAFRLWLFLEEQGYGRLSAWR